MANLNKVRCKSDYLHDRVMPYPLPSCRRKRAKDCQPNKKHSKSSEKKDWEGATCPVCLEYPHNAVLLLCSSYIKGCRPYTCATSHRFSNCLEQYKRAYTKVTSTEGMQERDRPMDNSSIILGAGQCNEKIGIPELLCPLCRGQVKGWTLVEPARKHLNAKKRTCMQDNCLFVGTYKQLRKHVRDKHPLARPRAVDPVLEEKWKKLECERERNDVISTIMSSTPGAMVLGDYVVEPGHHTYNDNDSDDSLDDGLFALESFDRGQSSGLQYHLNFGPFNEDDYGMRRPLSVGSAAVSGRGFRRILMGRSRRRRHRVGGNRAGLLTVD